MLAGAAFPAAFLTLGGFVLLLLVTLSVPIIDSIHLLVIEFGDSGRTAATIGVFGACYEGLGTSIAGFDVSTGSYCTDPSVGYNLDSTLLGELPGNEVGSVVIKGLAGSLVLNAVAAGFAGFSTIFALFAWFCASRFMEIVTFITLILAVIVAWLVWFLDLALVLVARNRINDYTNEALTGHIGNGLWLGLAGAVSLSLAICAAGCGVFGRYSHRHAGAYSDPAPVTKPARRWPWQRRRAGAGTY